MKRAAVIALLLCLTVSLQAQAPPDSTANNTDSLRTQNDSLSFSPQFRRGIKYYVNTTVGTSYSGFVRSENRDFVTLEDLRSHEWIELRKSTLTHIRMISVRESYLEEVAGENRYAGDYLFSTSAFLFQKKGIRFNLHWLSFESIEYDLTENFGLTTSTLVFYPVSLGVKCAFKLDERNYAGGSAFVAGNVLSRGSDVPLWGYGALGRFTHGSSNRNVTLSAGLVALNSNIVISRPQFAFVNLPFVSLAYSSRLGVRTALSLEGWYFPEYGTTLAGAGIRFVNNPEHSWVFGCYGVLNNFNSLGLNLGLRLVPIPYVGMIQKF